MSDAPERIWLDTGFQPWRVWKIQIPDLPEYRPADLPPTLAAAMELPEVKALVGAFTEVYWRLRSYAVHDDNCKLNKPPYAIGSCSCGLTAALNKGETALTAIKEKKDE